MTGEGSTAVTSHPRAASGTLRVPVPAPMSSTREPFFIPMPAIRASANSRHSFKSRMKWLLNRFLVVPETGTLGFPGFEKGEPLLFPLVAPEG